MPPIRTSQIIPEPTTVFPLSPRTKREKALFTLFKNNANKSKTSKDLGISRRSIYDIIKKMEEQGDLKDQPRSGRPKIVTEDQVQDIVKITLQNRWETPVSLRSLILKEMSLSICERTIKRILQEQNLHRRVPAKKPLLTQAHRDRRLQWCLTRQDWTVEQWKNLHFSDESRFNLFKCDGRKKVWRLPGERFLDACVWEKVKHDGGGKMVWGFISWDGVMELVEVKGSMDTKQYLEVLQGHYLEYHHQDTNNIFQQDGAPCHTSKKAQQWFEEKGVTVSDWPAQSPDLNPIEDIWNILDKAIRARERLPTSLRQLMDALIEEWQKIPIDVVRKLYEGMPTRMQAVIAAEGSHTCY